MGRTGTWFAAEQLPFVPDVITTAKGLGAGYAPIGAVLCRDEVYRAIAEGSRAFELGHTWDGAPLPCAVGLAVIDYLQELELVERVRDEGPRLLSSLEAALADCELVAEVRGRGFLLGIDYADPRDRRSFLPPELGVARRIDVEALARGLLVYSTQPTAGRLRGRPDADRARVHVHRRRALARCRANGRGGARRSSARCSPSWHHRR